MISNISNAVTVSNGQVTTSSLKVAEVFGKQHFHVIRDIEKLQVPDNFKKSNFGLTEREWKNSLGKTVKDKVYIITRDGFVLLVMGFTGAKAMQFKIAYLEEFNRMEAKLRELSAVPVQPELPLDSAPVPAGRFSPLRYQGVEVIPADELRKRLAITKGQFEAWLYSYKPMTDGVDVFRINGVPDKLALAMLKAGFKVNPNIISANLYTRSGFAKAAARFTAAPEVNAAAEVRELPIPRRPAGTSPVREMRFELNDVLKPFSTATVTLLEKLYTAGYDTEREIAEVVFMAGAIRRMREITALAGEQIEGVNASIAVQNGRLSSSLRYERAEN